MTWRTVAFALFVASCSSSPMPEPPSTRPVPWCVHGQLSKGAHARLCFERAAACDWARGEIERYSRWVPVRALGDCEYWP